MGALMCCVRYPAWQTGPRCRFSFPKDDYQSKGWINETYAFSIGNNVFNYHTSIRDLGIKASMDVFKEAIANGDFNIKEISSDLVPTMNNSLIEMQHLMIRIESTLNQYERSPSDIIYKQEEIKMGPGEH